VYEDQRPYGREGPSTAAVSSHRTDPDGGAVHPFGVTPAAHQKENSWAPDFSPKTRDPESSAAMDGEPHTPHGSSADSG
jgi:hypothetical protein